MNNLQLGKLVGPHLSIFFLYKRENPFFPILLNSFLNLLSNFFIKIFFRLMFLNKSLDINQKKSIKEDKYKLKINKRYFTIRIYTIEKIR